jgi:hypothetical protein
MKTARITLFALAASVGLSTLVASAPAHATDWSFLQNKPYIDCLNLFANGNFLIPANASAAQIAQKHEQGRQYCNRRFYGHN